VRISIVETGSIEDHARLINQQIEASLRDPQTRMLALRLVSGRYDWVQEPRSGRTTPTVEYHDQHYRVKADPVLCQARDTYCEVVQVWNFVVLNIRYTGDTDGYDTYQDLKTTLEAGAGDCDDMAIAFCALLRSLGHRCAIRIISQDGEAWSHVYPLVEFAPGKWMPLDATEEGKTPGWEFAGIAAHRDYLMVQGGV